MSTRKLYFSIDSVEWNAGVENNFFSTPLGNISKPSNLDHLVSNGWLIVPDAYISIHNISQELQLKFWFSIPEKTRNKIKYLSNNIYPVTDSNSFKDNHLIAYSTDGIKSKNIGFIFESITAETNRSLFVFVNSDIKLLSDEPDNFLKNYLNELKNSDIEALKKKGKELSRIEKLFRLFKKKK